MIRVKLAISVLWYSWDAVVRGVLMVAGRRPAPQFVVLYYHGVPAAARHGFARQMEALARRTKVLPAAYTGELPPARCCVAITFDDAFRSVREHAVPEMDRRGLPSTVFVPVDFIGRDPRWETEIGIGDGVEQVMTVDELIGLPKAVALGSHTLTHAHLARLDGERLREEVSGSRRRLEELTNAPVTLLAFPYGEYDAAVVEVCRQAGYERLFSIEPASADPRGRDFVRGRVAVEPDESPLTFHLKSHGAYRWMVHASAWKRRIQRWRTRP